METSLLRAPLSLFPIYIEKDLNVYIKGVRLRTIDTLTHTTHYVVGSKQHKLKALGAGTTLFKRYESTELSYQELHLLLDHIKDSVLKGRLNAKYLTDLNEQALVISKICGCVCSVAQLKRFHNQKHPIKQRLKRIKLLTNGVYKR